MNSVPGVIIRRDRTHAHCNWVGLDLTPLDGLLTHTRTRDEAIYFACIAWPVPKFLTPIECPECFSQPVNADGTLCGLCDGACVITCYDETEVST